MNQSTQILTIVTAFVLLAANYRTDGATMTNVELSGFQTFPTPRTFDGPGTVFRIAKDRTRFPVIKLNLPIDRGEERFASYTKRSAWSLGAVLKFVGAMRLLSDARVSANLASNVDLTVQIGQGARERTYDADVKTALKAASIDYRDDSRYYIIRETIAVSELSYRFASGSDLSADLAAAIRKVVDSTFGLKWVNSEQTEFNQTFDRPLRVFFTAEEIVAPTGLLGTESERRRVTEPLEWTTESQ